jgi:hypothetical protein
MDASSSLDNIEDKTIYCIIMNEGSESLISMNAVDVYFPCHMWTSETLEEKVILIKC